MPSLYRKFKKKNCFLLLILLSISWIFFLILATASLPLNKGDSWSSNKSYAKGLPIGLLAKRNESGIIRSSINNNRSSDNNYKLTIGIRKNEVYDDPHSITAEVPGAFSPEEELAPGEMGRPYRFPKNLTKEQNMMMDEGWMRNGFNQFVSDLISVRRSLPDMRDEECKNWTRSNLLPNSKLPQTSVIICFHNEPWSTLLRSVHSILDRSPPELIREIILVDDFSDLDHLKRPLEVYMSAYPKVKIVRATERLGLVRARLLGNSVANGPVVTFLDSHIETTTGWLEPLLDRIARNSTTVVCPIIDDINLDTFEYRYHDLRNNTTFVGGFDWELTYTWDRLPDRKYSAEPIRSPTMPGGLFAISKDFFERIGTYDPGFEIWGRCLLFHSIICSSENLELSFKTWMCGGTLEFIPCSHVGHVYRDHSPYKWKDNSDVLRSNSVRLALVWMDEYAEYYLRRIGHDVEDIGNISSRLKLRSELKCKNFEWYVKNIYPDLFIPWEELAHGEVRALGLNATYCLESPVNMMRYPVEAQECHRMGGNQYWVYSITGEIYQKSCIDYDGTNITTYPCHKQKENQMWIFDYHTGLLRHGPTKKCLAITAEHKLQMEPCDSLNVLHLWDFENFNRTAGNVHLARARKEYPF